MLWQLCPRQDLPRADLSEEHARAGPEAQSPKGTPNTKPSETLILVASSYAPLWIWRINGAYFMRHLYFGA